MAGANETVENVVKKRNDAYTGLLAISFLAMTGGSVLLYLEYQNYENKTPPKAPVIDVPGTQLKVLPGTGGAPKIEPKVVPPEEMPMKEDMKMSLPPADSRPVPLVLPRPAEPVERVQAMPAPLSGVVQIPDVPAETP